VLESRVRQLIESEQRLLRAKRRDLQTRSRGRPWAVAGIGLAFFGALWALTVAVSDAPWHVVTVFWMFVGTGITLWVRRDLNKDVPAFDAMLVGINSALQANKAKSIDVKAKAFVSFEEVEDEGACYAFEVCEDTLFFLLGQQYYEKARFPSLDFSLVQSLDERGRIVDEWIVKRGPKATPDRVIPAAQKWQLNLPDDQVSIKGRLDEIEALLGTRSGAAV